MTAVVPSGSDTHPATAVAISLLATLTDLVVLPSLLVAPLVVVGRVGSHLALGYAGLMLTVGYYVTAFEQIDAHTTRGPVMTAINRRLDDSEPHDFGSGRPDECSCVPPGTVDLDTDPLPCFDCWMAGFDDPNPAVLDDTEDSGDQINAEVIAVE